MSLQVGCAGVEKMKKPEPIGYAEISADGTITLHLAGSVNGGAIAHMTKAYKPNDPYYADVVAHIGVIKPGEQKPVLPWPEQAEQKKPTGD